jgi:hypothetical protein
MKTKSNSVKAHTVQIANPIYDYAFKYLMEDNEVARKFVSTIIGEEVIELSFSPQEYVNREDEIPEKPWAIYRLDFTARIRTNEGLKVVMIEIQKVSLRTDIVRFRRYLGIQYQTQREEITVKDGDENKVKYRAIPIYCIFVIGDGIGIDGVPLVKVGVQVEDGATCETLKEESNEFVKNLHHRSWIVQVPELKNRRSNKVEVLLSIFDQTNRLDNDHHLLNIQEENYPAEYRPIIRRLELAAADKTVRNAMMEEDYVLEHIRMEIMDKDAIIAKERAEKEAAIAEKEAAIAAQATLLAEIEVLKKQLNK